MGSLLQDFPVLSHQVPSVGSDFVAFGAMGAEDKGSMVRIVMGAVLRARHMVARVSVTHVLAADRTLGFAQQPQATCQLHWVWASLQVHTLATMAYAHMVRHSAYGKDEDGAT